MLIKEAKFIKSSAKLEDCPQSKLPEYAFIGRSNVGKSSLINYLTGRKELAKTSSKPGKTQLINHFLINEQWYLVDLPGYGWAKVSKTEKAKWQKMISYYLQNRENLSSVFVLIDSRHEPQNNDLEFTRWLGEKQIPFSIIFTKTDKQGKNQTMANIALYRRILKKDWDELPNMFLTSSSKKEGKDQVLEYIDQINQSI